MHKTPRSISRPLVALTVAFLAAACGAASAQTQVHPAGVQMDPSPNAAAVTRRPTAIDHTGMYRSEVQACLSGRTQQAQTTCLMEARNAHAEKRQGQLVTRGEDYRSNALQRCMPFTGENRAACEARVLGFGGTSGSVAGGGILRWVETVVMPAGQPQVSFFPQTREPLVLRQQGR